MDLWLLRCGRDYLGALERFYHLTDNLSPRYALGNCGVGIGLIPVRSTILNGSFLGAEGALAVSVIDMDWSTQRFLLALEVVDGAALEPT